METKSSPFVDRHYALCAVAVLSLCFFNVAFRLGQESLQEWDESLYAISAWEAVTQGNWLGTTFLGELDYYNTKPPLNVWLIALAFKTFGVSLVSLRLVSATSAFLTVVVLQIWTRRLFGSVVALLSSFILATTFGFLYVHSGRTANTDALFALLMLLTAVTLVAEERRPWVRAAIGPLLAAAFLLRGMAVLMPLALVVVVDLLGRTGRRRSWTPSAVAATLAIVPIAAWIIARYGVDRWEFLARLFGYDFVQRSFVKLEGHEGGWLYYLNVLQRHQYDWLLMGGCALALSPGARARVRGAFIGWRQDRAKVVFAAWALVAVGIPTLMQSKLAWYLNPFYPVFAVGTALVVSGILSDLAARERSQLRLCALATIFLAVSLTAEARLLWYSYQYRAIAQSRQALILEARETLQGKRLFQDEYNRSAMFIAEAMAGAHPQPAPLDRCCFQTATTVGDFLLTTKPVDSPGFDLARTNGRRWLYRRNADQ